MTTAALFALGLLLILAGAELFTNAVEWAGYCMKLASGATGSLLAALGTALPETVVPVVALAGGQPDAESVAVGSVLGASFLLLTLGSAVTGIAVALRPRGRIELDPAQVRRDLGLFCAAFSLVLLGIVLPLPARVASGVALLAAYALYVRATLGGGNPAEDMPEPLHLFLRRHGPPPAALIAIQLALAVGLLVVGSRIFVDGITATAASLRISALTLALVVVPLATELPETFNSVLWVRSGDDRLAYGNIAGSAAFQACVLGFIGLAFTSWRPDRSGVVGGVLTLGTGLALLTLLRHGRVRGTTLILAALPWLGYVAAELASGGGLGA